MKPFSSNVVKSFLKTQVKRRIRENNVFRNSPDDVVKKISIHPIHKSIFKNTFKSG